MCFEYFLFSRFFWDSEWLHWSTVFVSIMPPGRNNSNRASVKRTCSVAYNLPTIQENWAHASSLTQLFVHYDRPCWFDVLSRKYATANEAEDSGLIVSEFPTSLKCYRSFWAARLSRFWRLPVSIGGLWGMGMLGSATSVRSTKN